MSPPNNIGYHTRLYSNPNTKVTGGSFGGSIDMETVNRLVSSFKVVVKPSGTPVFVDKEGREVFVYISVDARSTEKGKAALREHSVMKEKLEVARQNNAEREEQEIEDLMSVLTHEEIVSRLKGGSDIKP